MIVYERLPEDIEVFRGDGETYCTTCGKKMKDHPRYRYPWGDNFAVKHCDGTFYHL